MKNSKIVHLFIWISALSVNGNARGQGNISDIIERPIYTMRFESSVVELPRCKRPTLIESSKNPTARWEKLGQCSLKSTSSTSSGDKEVFERRVINFVDIPVWGQIFEVKVAMRNEPWGGSQTPAKPNTDDLGSIDFKPCPMGSGECSIGWGRVDGYATEIIGDVQRVYAVFYNWAGRNDRYGLLIVSYSN